MEMACGNTVAVPARATPCSATFHQFYCIDRENDVNRAMVVYRAHEEDTFKPMHLVMDVTTGTRWVTTNTPSAHEVVIHELTFDEQVDELFDSAVFAISNEADDRASHQLPTCDAFNDVTVVMCEVERGLNTFGFNGLLCDAAASRIRLDDADGFIR